MAREGEMTRVFASSRAVHLALLSLPFVAVVAATSGLRHVFSVYQSYDELHHHAIVVHVAHVWPRAVLDGYESWSGPLVYWLLAGVTRPFGASLEAGRLVVALFSWATCAVAYVVFRDRLGASPRVALALAFVLALSPFFFGESFYVLTDNPTWFFVVLALERLLAYVREPAAGRVAAYALFAAAATLMRQISVWLLVPGVVAAASVRCSPRLRTVAAASLLLAVVPLALLLVHWGGPLPGGGYQTDPAAFRVRNVCLGLAVVGLYALLLVPVEELRSLPRRLGRRGGLACGVVAALAVAAVAVGAMGNVAQRDIYGIGLLGKLLEGWPVVAGAGVVWCGGCWCLSGPWPWPSSCSRVRARSPTACWWPRSRRWC